MGSFDRLAISLFGIALLALAACESRERVGSSGSSDGGVSGLGEGTACTCTYIGDNCCADGLFCFATEPCNVMTDSGCYTEGECVPKRAWGETCEDARQCADADAHCAGPLEGPATCQPPPVGEERCERDGECSPGRVCERSYCLLMPGESCSSGADCASGICDGAIPRCL